MNSITKNLVLTSMNILYKISPRKELELLSDLKAGYKLDLDNPITYN